MTLYPSILCAIDFSDHSRRALRLALALAARQGSRVLAVHVIDPLLAEAAEQMSRGAALRRDVDGELRALVDAERQTVADAPAVSCQVVTGPAAPEILSAAQGATATLVVMGTQGLGGLRKLFFGSIAEKVLRDAPVPILAVPLPDDADAGGVPVMEAVIAAVELDATADAVASHAATFAATFGLPLTLLHVVPPIQGAPRSAAAAQAAERLHETNAQARLAALSATLNFAGEVTLDVRSGVAAEEIAAAAAGHALVTLACGGDAAHHRPGSIAYRVLCLSDSPVLAIPARRGT